MAKPPRKPKIAPRKLDLARCSRIKFLEYQIRELEALASDEDTWAKAPNAVVAARSKASDLRASLDELREVAKRRPPRKKGDPGDEVLDETRWLRTAASRAGSFVAAANLLKLERELISAADADRRAREAEEMAHLDEAGLVALLVEHLLAIPPELQERVREAVYGRRPPGDPGLVN